LIFSDFRVLHVFESDSILFLMSLHTYILNPTTATTESKV